MKSNNTLLYIGIAAAVIGGGYVIAGNSKSKLPAQPDPALEPINAPQPTKPLNTKLLLKQGVTGQEVAKLQSYIGVTDDGVFGPQTEAALYKLKAVRETTLEKYPTLPTVNQSRIASGSTIMAINRNGANIYFANQRADGMYYITGEIFKKIAYGKSIGVVRSSSQLGNWYLVKMGPENYNIICFVKAVDVKKI